MIGKSHRGFLRGGLQIFDDVDAAAEAVRSEAAAPVGLLKVSVRDLLAWGRLAEVLAANRTDAPSVFCMVAQQRYVASKGNLVLEFVSRQLEDKSEPSGRGIG